MQHFPKVLSKINWVYMMQNRCRAFIIIFSHRLRLESNNAWYFILKVCKKKNKHARSNATFPTVINNINLVPSSASSVASHLSLFDLLLPNIHCQNGGWPGNCVHLLAKYFMKDWTNSNKVLQKIIIWCTVHVKLITFGVNLIEDGCTSYGTLSTQFASSELSTCVIRSAADQPYWVL